MGKPTVSIKVTDTTGQLERHASVPREAQVAELIDALLPQLNLPANDIDGRPVTYHLRNDRTGQQLVGTQTVSEVIEENDTVRVMPEITPGINP